MSEGTSQSNDLSRRDFLTTTGVAAIAAGTGALGASSLAGSAYAESSSMSTDAGKSLNILFILTDQERYFDPKTLPVGYSLPGRERIRKEGVTFVNHQIATSVCSSSRSVIYTGQHIQHTGVFDNLGFPWSKELSTETPTVGSYLTEAGYHPAYLGKNHMIEALENVEVNEAPNVNMDDLNKILKQYGFNDYVGVGDVIGHTLGGYKSDEFTVSTAVRWLRSRAPQLQKDAKPWYLAVNLVNPHDVMYYNTDLPGSKPVQAANTAFEINHEPPHALYQRRWNMPLPQSRNKAWDAPGRPRAHYEFQYARKALCGQFPDEDDRWRRLQDYYLNCIADCDRHIDRLLLELDELGLADNTVVIITSDHGELAGAHGMHGKGATAYREQVNVPLWIRHPAHKDSGGAECAAVTSHLDLTPTILSMAGLNNAQRASIAPELRGKDISGLLMSPDSAKTNAVREGALYNFNMWLYQDSEFMQQAVAAMAAGQNVGELGLRIDMNKRGAIRSVTDGRYRFSRYFSPRQHNLPTSLEQLTQYNDVELFDLEADPFEMNNLAADPKRHGDLMLAMNAKLSAAIDAEVGEDDGRFLPENKAGWNVTFIDP